MLIKNLSMFFISIFQRLSHFKMDRPRRKKARQAESRAASSFINRARHATLRKDNRMKISSIKNGRSVINYNEMRK